MREYTRSGEEVQGIRPLGQEAVVSLLHDGEVEWSADLVSAAGAPARPGDGADLAAAAARFNLERSNVTRFRVSGHWCQSRACPHCGPVRGYETREVLRSKAHLFRAPAMLTFTVDRHGKTTGLAWRDAQEAHEEVTGQRYIARLMRYVGIEVWVCVLEFQQKTGEGWPHWHLLVDLAPFGGRLPKEKMHQIWRLWRDKWCVGGWDIEKLSFKDAEHAICYTTKYLVKQPEGGYPVWVLESRKCVRLVSASKAVGSLSGEVSRGVEDERGGEVYEDEGGPEGRKLVERLTECGCRSVVFCEGMDQAGVVISRYEGMIEVSADRVREMVEDGEIEGEVIECAGERGRKWKQVFVTAGGLKGLQSWRPDPEEWWVLSDRREQKRLDILSRWRVTQELRSAGINLRKGERYCGRMVSLGLVSGGVGTCQR